MSPCILGKENSSWNIVDAQSVFKNMNETQTSPGISVLFYILVCETWYSLEWTGSAKVGDGLPRLPHQLVTKLR